MIDAFLLYVATFFLFSIMDDLGQRNQLMYLENSGSMEVEKRRLKVILVVFGSSYLLRAGFAFSVAFYLVEFLSLVQQYQGFFELG